MNLITKFKYCSGKLDEYGNQLFTEEGRIKEELIPSQINFYNSNGDFIEMDWKKVELYSIKLSGYGNFKNVLSIKELEFIAKAYDLKTTYDKDGDLKATLKHIHPDYFPGMMKFFEKDGKEYLIISFNRISGLYAPQARPDISYVHGIWENPLLTDEIIEKIKQA